LAVPQIVIFNLRSKFNSRFHSLTFVGSRVFCFRHALKLELINILTLRVDFLNATNPQIRVYIKKLIVAQKVKKFQTSIELESLLFLLSLKDPATRPALS
jgi:hypothetical protein